MHQQQKKKSYQGEPRWTTSGWPASKFETLKKKVVGFFLHFFFFFQVFNRKFLQNSSKRTLINQEKISSSLRDIAQIRNAVRNAVRNALRNAVRNAVRNALRNPSI